MHDSRLPRYLLGLLLAGSTLAGAEPLQPGPDEALLYYQRSDGDYAGWGLHLWNTAQCSGVRDGTSWDQPLVPAGIDSEHGAWFSIPLSADASCLNLIMHRGDDKDLGGGDLIWRLDELGRRAFSQSGSAQLSATPIVGGPSGAAAGAAAAASGGAGASSIGAGDSALAAGGAAAPTASGSVGVSSVGHLCFRGAGAFSQTGCVHVRLVCRRPRWRSAGKGR